MQNRKLIILPCKDEGGTIQTLIHRLNRALPDCDLVVIDDGSVDDTVFSVPPSTTVLSLPFNLGIGGAMQTGYRYAALNGYDIAVQVDGDGQHRPTQVRKLLDRLEASNVDMVVGSRFLEPSALAYRQTLGRRAGGLVLNGLIRLLTGLRMTDCTSGFRAVNRSVIEAFACWYPEDYPEPEVILLLTRAGYRVEEVPTLMRQRRMGRSSISTIKGLYYVTKVGLCLILDMLRHPWPERHRAPANATHTATPANSASATKSLDPAKDQAPASAVPQE